MNLDMSNRTEIDVRAIPPGERHARILGIFDGLAANEAMVLASERCPRPHLYQLQVERRGQFEWSPLEEGPAVWRIRIDRRGPEAPLSRSVAEYLSWDHDRLDQILAGWRREAERGDRAGAKRRALELATGLRRHIRMEEEVLFPAFDQRSGMRDAGPTRVMREEHREIESALADLVRSTEVSSPGAEALHHLSATLAKLLALLGEHNLKEESVLYPAVDGMHDEAERDKLVAAMQRL